jgi:D-alanine-D-alanine ligase
MNAFPKKIAVLKGGPSAEREVSLKSGAAAAEALRTGGFDVTEITVEGPDFILPAGTELAFLALHGTFGEDGQVQEILQARGIPYTGANAEVSRIAFDKEKTKDKFRAAGVPTPEGRLVASVDEVTLPLPLFVKPNEQGSSVGTHPATTREELAAALADALKFGPRALVERFIVGRELTVGVLGEQALPIVEIHPLDGFYDYTNKYTKGRTEYFCPAPLTDDVTRAIQQLALAAHRSLGRTVYSRIDFLLQKDMTAFCLEVNTLPGMTATSLLPKAALAAGLDFPALCRTIIELSWTARLEEHRP